MARIWRKWFQISRFIDVVDASNVAHHPRCFAITQLIHAQKRTSTSRRRSNGNLSSMEATGNQGTDSVAWNLVTSQLQPKKLRMLNMENYSCLPGCEEAQTQPLSRFSASIRWKKTRRRTSRIQCRTGNDIVK